MNEVAPIYEFLLPSHECVYTKCYCEENVWHLCDYIRRHHAEELQKTFAVFISNPLRKIPLWHQKAGTSTPDFMVVWDYHVILVHQQASGQSYVYDLDSRFDFPCDFDSYASQTFRDDSVIRSDFHRFFRVVSADVYLSTFASDRSHMLLADGTWSSPPPDYPCICTQENSNNLQQFISMQSEVGQGHIVDLETFVSTFSADSAT